jgi:hypothetical protein
MTPELLSASNKALLSYVDIIKVGTGLNTNQILIMAGINRYLVNNVKRGQHKRSPYISLGLILKLYQVHKIPFRTDELPELFK